MNRFKKHPLGFSALSPGKPPEDPENAVHHWHNNCPSDDSMKAAIRQFIGQYHSNKSHDGDADICDEYEYDLDFDFSRHGRNQGYHACYDYGYGSYASSRTSLHGAILAQQRERERRLSGIHGRPQSPAPDPHIDDIHDDKQKWTLVHWACSFGYLDVARVLIQQFNANPDLLSNDGETPLLLASAKGHTDVVRYLTKLPNVDVNCVQKHGRIPNTVKTLDNPLHVGCKAGNIEVIRQLVGNPNIDLDKEDGSGCTPLQIACKTGNMDVVRYLVENTNVQVCKLDKSGNTVLHTACQQNSLELVRYLVENTTIPVNKRSIATRREKTCHLGLTPLHIACKNGYADIIHYLVKHANPDVNIQTQDGDTPLHYACRQGSVDIIRFLVEHANVNINTRTIQKGESVLHIACQNGKVDLIRYLVEQANADVSIQSYQRRYTPLFLAYEKGNNEAVQYLLEHRNVDANIPDEHGFTFLHLACEKGDLQLVRYLVELKHVDVNIRSNDSKSLFKRIATSHRGGGYTPLHCACEKLHVEVVRYLVEHSNVDLTSRNNIGKSPRDLVSKPAHEPNHRKRDPRKDEICSILDDAATKGTRQSPRVSETIGKQSIPVHDVTSQKQCDRSIMILQSDKYRLKVDESLPEIIGKWNGLPDQVKDDIAKHLMHSWKVSESTVAWVLNGKVLNGYQDLQSIVEAHLSANCPVVVHQRTLEALGKHVVPSTETALILALRNAQGSTVPANKSRASNGPKQQAYLLRLLIDRLRRKEVHSKIQLTNENGKRVTGAAAAETLLKVFLDVVDESSLHVALKYDSTLLEKLADHRFMDTLLAFLRHSGQCLLSPLNANHTGGTNADEEVVEIHLDWLMRKDQIMCGDFVHRRIESILEKRTKCKGSSVEAVFAHVEELCNIPSGHLKCIDDLESTMSCSLVPNLETSPQQHHQWDEYWRLRRSNPGKCWVVENGPLKQLIQQDFPEALLTGMLECLRHGESIANFCTALERKYRAVQPVPEKHSILIWLAVGKRFHLLDGKSLEGAIATEMFLLLIHFLQVNEEKSTRAPRASLSRKEVELTAFYLMSNQDGKSLADQSVLKAANKAESRDKCHYIGEKTVAEKWKNLKKTQGATCAPMDELMDMIGMKDIKGHALKIFTTMRAAKQLPKQSRVPTCLNFTFMGNPGTGKTSVARILGKLLHAVNARKGETFNEITATKLKRDGGEKFEELVKNSLDGVLFIDEAYQLDPLNDPAGCEIVDEILTAAENYRDRLTIILAGYKEEIETKLYAYNSGMLSRFQEITFHDFSDNQLRKIWDKFLRDYKWSVTSDDVSCVAVQRVARRKGMKGFGNARDVRSAFVMAYERATTRCDLSPHRQTFVMEDVLGPRPSRSNLPELDHALSELENLTGLEKVKQSVRELVDLVADNYERELTGKPIVEVAQNRLMLGNPGTGKTTVAKIYAQILKSLNLVSKGAVELKTASDFIGGQVGETQKKASNILANCQGKVLVIDEAYNLNDNGYGKQAVDTIVEKVMGIPGEDIAVLLCGYEREMQDMLREQNAGLARRFNPSNALYFDDYDNTSLVTILQDCCKQEGIQISFSTCMVAIEVLAEQRELGNFGNAGAVKNLLSAAKLRMTSRLRTSSNANRDAVRTNRLELTVDDIKRHDRDRDPGLSRDPLAPVRKLHGARSIIQRLEKLQIHLGEMKKRGRPIPTRHYLFVGSPGTGKTTVARSMGKMLCELGVTVRPGVIETTAADLCGTVVGEAKTLVETKLGQARGGILFIDEAYELGKNSFGQEAMAKLVELMTSPEYKTKTVVIAAGYEDAIHQMLQRNSGLKSRFQETISFPDWSPDDCQKCFVACAQNDGFQVSAEAHRALFGMFEKLRCRPGWANARDAITTYEHKVLPARSERVHKEGKDTPQITYDDVLKGMEEFLKERPEGPCVDESGEVSRRKVLAIQQSAELEDNDNSCLSQVRIEENTSTKWAYCSAQKESKELQASEATACDNEEENLGKTFEKRRKEYGEWKKEQEEKKEKLRREIEELRRKETEERRRLEDLRLQHQRAREEAERQRLAMLERQRELERQRILEQERKKLEEQAKIREEEKNQEKLRELGRCPQSFRWIQLGNGNYRCEGGSHFIHESELKC